MLTKGQKTAVTLVVGVAVGGGYLAAGLYTITHEPTRFHWWIVLAIATLGFFRTLFKMTKDLVDGE